MTPTLTVRSGPLQLAVYTWGEPAVGKPNVVLVHGYPDAASVWSRSAPLLAKTCFVVAYDVRGAGRSDVPDGSRAYALNDLVQDLATVIEATCGNGAVHLVGHDWGSIQGWEAVTTGRIGGRIASFTSISGPGLDHAGHWIRKRLRSGSLKDMALVARQLRRSWYIGAFQLPVLGESLWKLGLGRRWPEVLRRTEGIEAVATDTQTKDGTNGINLYRANFLRRLGKPAERRTNIPVQLIVPRLDRFMVREIWDDLPHWAPRLWRREIDAGHWLPISHPRPLAQMAGEFIQFVETGKETAALRWERQGRHHPP